MRHRVHLPCAHRPAGNLGSNPPLKNPRNAGILLSPFCGIFQSRLQGATIISAVQGSKGPTVTSRRYIMETIRKLFIAVLLTISLQGFAAEPVNINSADKATLMAVRGVGEVRAEAIINYREKNGPFKSVDQLIEVEGIGKATVDANREFLTVGSSQNN